MVTTSGRLNLTGIVPERAGEAISALFTQHQGRSQDPVVLLQIGANDLGGAGNSDRFVRTLVQHPRVTGILLEPNPVVFERLQLSLRGLGVTERAFAYRLAMCLDSSTKNVDFFTVSERFGKAFPQAPHWAKYEIGSMSRESVIKTLAQYAASTHHASRNRQKFTYSAKVGDQFAKFVNKISVPCRTPATVFHDIGVRAEEVDMLLIDAEGLDLQLVAGFVGLRGFGAKVISFESKVRGEQQMRLRRVLAAAGWETTCGRNCPEHSDVFAWRLAELRPKVAPDSSANASQPASAREAAR